jgi:hypothetical protein
MSPSRFTVAPLGASISSVSPAGTVNELTLIFIPEQYFSFMAAMQSEKDAHSSAFDSRGYIVERGDCSSAALHRGCEQDRSERKQGESGSSEHDV